MKKFSLKKRLIFAVVASQILLATGLVLVGTSFSRHYARRAFDVLLEGRAQSIAAIVYYPDDGSPGLLFNETKVPPNSNREHQDLFWVASDHGDFARQTPGVDPGVFTRIPGDVRFWNFRLKGVPYRAIVLRDVSVQDTEEGVQLPLPKLTVVYAASVVGIERQARSLALSIGLLSLLIFVPILLLALWSMRKALAPLGDLTAAASSVSVESWKFTPSESARSTTELEPLIGAMSTVLAGLEAAFTRQREFLGDAAHELKTSLAILKSTLQSLLNKPRERDEYEAGLAVMSRDCDRLEHLLNRMLQTARAEQRIAAGQPRDLASVDLASSCEAAIAKLASFAASRGIQIDFTALGEAAVKAQMADLELIWLNLLENAIQYSPSGSIVSMKLCVRADLAAVSLIDQGCGIAPEHLPKIFERFYRADSSRSRATGGFGLGLAIAKSLVNLYKGQIRAESEPGRGTTITVEFPLDLSGTGSLPTELTCSGT
jgi:signal transduction histidine kinase